MHTDLILYDRLWLSEYIEHLQFQRSLVDRLKAELEKQSARSSLERKILHRDVLSDVNTLEESLRVTEYTLRKYLDNVQDAAFRLQNECQNIDIPLIFE